jgi:hypothetical protein
MSTTDASPSSTELPNVSASRIKKTLERERLSLDRSSDRVYRAQLFLPATMAAPIASIEAWVRPANSPVPIQAAGGWLD